MFSMKKLRVCPNCGLTVFGSKCKRCRYVFPNDKAVAREEAKRPAVPSVEPIKPVAPEPVSEARPEASASTPTMSVMEAQQRVRHLIRAAEQSARAISNRAKADADALD